ncbi:MAG: hypothetical protein H6715_02880 [Myxococcales bacterium]|nr:hypothetical protein [Myxococcales bacterium]MCB9708188.1 hypothetical protein [Myxococcales bacterium]
MAQTTTNATDAHRMGSDIKEEISTLQEEAKSRVKQIAASTTDKLKRAGSYIKEQDFDSIADDVTRVVRRYPAQSVAVCLGVGYLLGRAMRRS